MTTLGLVRRAAATLLPRTIMIVRGSRRVPRVALTFDDGPDPLTRALLDRLDELEVRSTFFVIGSRCAERRDDLHETVRRGHEVAGHGYSHARFPTLDAAGLRDELDRTAALILPSERRRALVRPPGGHATLRSTAQVAAHGYASVLWSLDSYDARTRDPGEVARRAGAAQAGDIVLLHEGQSWTLEALPELVARLRERGLEPSTVSELLDAR